MAQRRTAASVFCDEAAVASLVLCSTVYMVVVCAGRWRLLGLCGLTSRAEICVIQLPVPNGRPVAAFKDWLAAQCYVHQSKVCLVRPAAAMYCGQHWYSKVQACLPPWHNQQHLSRACCSARQGTQYASGGYLRCTRVVTQPWHLGLLASGPAAYWIGFCGCPMVRRVVQQLPFTKSTHTWCYNQWL